MEPLISKQWRANWTNLSTFFGYLPDPQSAFRGIHKLPAGHTLTFKDSRLTLSRYWDFQYPEAKAAEPARSENYYIERLRELLKELTSDDERIRPSGK